MELSLDSVQAGRHKISSDDYRGPISNDLGLPANEFVIQDFTLRDPSMIAPYVQWTLDTFEDFVPSSCFMSMVSPFISVGLLERLSERHAPGDETNDCEFLCSLNETFLNGARKRYLIRSHYMKMLEFGYVYVVVPDLEAILQAWTDKHQDDKKTGLEEELILKNYPAWFVSLFKKVEKEDGKSVLAMVFDVVQEDLYTVKMQKLMVDFINAKLIKVQSSSCCMTRRSSKPIKIDSSFLVVASVIHIPSDLLSDLIDMVKPPLSQVSISQLQFLNNL